MSEFNATPTNLVDSYLQSSWKFKWSVHLFIFAKVLSLTTAIFMFVEHNVAKVMIILYALTITFSIIFALMRLKEEKKEFLEIDSKNN